MTERNKHEYHQSGPYLGWHKDDAPKTTSFVSHIGTCGKCKGRVLQSTLCYLTSPPQYDPAFCETCKRKVKPPPPPKMPVLEMEE